MPEGMSDSAIAYSSLPTTYTTDTNATEYLSDNDFAADFVSVDTFGTKLIGK